MNTYKNPVSGKVCVFGGDYPEYLTKEELITLASEHTIGTCHSIEGEFDRFLEWIENETREKIDFRFENLSLEELSIVDEIVFTCSQCGWNCSTSEQHEQDCESYCEDCYDEVLQEEDEDY